VTARPNTVTTVFLSFPTRKRSGPSGKNAIAFVGSARAHAGTRRKREGADDVWKGTPIRKLALSGSPLAPSAAAHACCSAAPSTRALGSGGGGASASAAAAGEVAILCCCRPCSDAGASAPAPPWCEGGCLRGYSGTLQTNVVLVE
jgi:hypothetical protein